MASHIVGVSGRKRSGKDSFAARLVSHHGFTRIAFADPLKAVALDLDPLVRVEPDEVGILYGPGALYRRDCYHRLSALIHNIGWEEAKRVREVRRLLQHLGSAVRDHVDQEAWIQAALMTAVGVPGPVVIPDVRFPNEAERVRWDGGKVVRITRPGLPDTDLHISETALDDLVPDYAVLNDADLDKLQRQADEVAASVLSA